MSRHIAFLESNATGSGYEAIQTARKCGCHVTFVTRSLDYYLRSGLLTFPLDAVDRVVTCETNDVAAIVAALRPFARELSALISVGEWYMEAAAVAAHLLGLPGQHPDSVRAARDKSRTRELLAGAGLPSLRFARVTCAEQARGAGVGFPCVVKPVDDSMSHGVRLCRTPDEAAAHVALLLSQTHNIRGQRKIPAVLIEEYASGPEVSVEAYAFEGHVQTFMVTQKLVVPPPEFIEIGHTVPVPLDTATRQSCIDSVKQGLAAIGYDFGAVHAELRLTAQGPRIIEINCRLAGGQITRLVKLATGMDMTKTLIDMHLGEPPPSPRPAERGAAIVFLLGRAGIVRSVAGADAAGSVPGVREVCVLAEPGATLRRPAGNADRIGHVIATGSTGAVALEAAMDAAAAIRIDIDGGGKSAPGQAGR
jgi:biotin carboxylase